MGKVGRWSVRPFGKQQLWILIRATNENRTTEKLVALLCTTSIMKLYLDQVLFTYSLTGISCVSCSSFYGRSIYRRPSIHHLASKREKSHLDPWTTPPHRFVRFGPDKLSQMLRGCFRLLDLLVTKSSLLNNASHHVAVSVEIISRHASPFPCIV